MATRGRPTLIGPWPTIGALMVNPNLISSYQTIPNPQFLYGEGALNYTDV